MAELTEQQVANLKQRRSVQDLNDLILLCERDGSVSFASEDPFKAIEDDEEREAAEADRDQQLATSRLLAEGPENAPGPDEEELSGNLEAAQAAGEVEEEAPAAKSSKKAAASAEGA